MLDLKLKTSFKFSDFKRYLGKDLDINRVEKAFIYAKQAHRNQLRKSGRPYFEHPLWIAKVAAQLKIDTEGAEYKILEDLYNSGVLNKIDLLMGECHFGIEKLEGYLNDFNPIFLDYQYGSKDICTFYFERVE